MVEDVLRVGLAMYSVSKHLNRVEKIPIVVAVNMCEGVGEDSGHEIGHVDIRVGSCNCLDVIVCHDMCT